MSHTATAPAPIAGVPTGSHVLIGANPFYVLDGTNSARGYVTLRHLASERTGNYRASQTRPMTAADLEEWRNLAHARDMARTEPTAAREEAASALLSAWIENHGA